MMTFLLIAGFVSVVFLGVRALLTEEDWDDIWKDDEE